MTDRVIVYSGSIPLDTDVLSTNKNMMVALASLSQAVFGTGTVFDGLACTPTTPASMSVLVGAGSIYSLAPVDSTAYGSLSADTTHSILKQGILLDPVTLTLTAPTTTGFAQNYLVQVSYADSDANPIVLPYYNASNPTQAYSGPNNSGTANNTVRKGTVTVALKAGASATSGNQTTPSADAGYTPLYVITVAFGQTSISSGNIVQVSNAPVIPYKLPQLRPGASTMQVFYPPGTYTFTPAPGVTRVLAEVWGAGGGGAGSNTGQAGGGGGGGGHSRRWCTVTPGQTITVTVASGGAAGPSQASGAPGGTSSFGSFCSATGGGGGQWGGLYAGGAGGQGSGGDINPQGGHGSGGLSGTNGLGGDGASAALGGGNCGASAGGFGVAAFPGGGGSGFGGSSAASGAPGAHGLVVVTY